MKGALVMRKNVSFRWCKKKRKKVFRISRANATSWIFFASCELSHVMFYFLPCNFVKNLLLGPTIRMVKANHACS